MRNSEALPRLRARSHEKFDGSVWRQYETPDSIIILTGMGRKLIATEQLSKVLRKYAGAVHSNNEGPEHNRTFLAEGGNAQVFTLGGKQLVIKEKKRGTADQLLPALERMDRLMYAVENNCPRWIDIPKHYGILLPKKDRSREFMLMDKIDDGVTVGDILHHDQPREPHISESVLHNFGPVTPKLHADITKRWDVLKGEVRKALMAEHMNPDELLPDMDHNAYNILVEKADVPIAGSPYKFWIIDQ